MNKNYIVVGDWSKASDSKVYIYSSATSSKPHELVHTITMDRSNRIWDVSIREDDTIVAVSANFNDTFYDMFSPMIVYERHERSWEQTFAYKWKSPFHPIQLSISGHHIAVARARITDETTESGERFVDTFRRTRGQWNINQSIELPKCENCDLSILAVNLLDEKMVISAPDDSQEGPDIFVYELDKDSREWVQDGLPIYSLDSFNPLWNIGGYYNPRSVAIQGDLVAVMGTWFPDEDYYVGAIVFKRRDTMGFVDWLPYIKLKITEDEEDEYLPSNVILDGNMVYVSYFADEYHWNRPGFVNVYDLNQVHSLV